MDLAILILFLVVLAAAGARPVAELARHARWICKRRRHRRGGFVA